MGLLFYFIIIIFVANMEHTFEETFLMHASWCSVCDGMIWKIGNPKKAWECKNEGCGDTVHIECYSSLQGDSLKCSHSVAKKTEVKTTPGFMTEIMLSPRVTRKLEQLKNKEEPGLVTESGLLS